MKYCRECGTKLDNDVQFCPKCGHRQNLTYKIQSPIDESQNKINTKQRQTTSLVLGIISVALSIFGYASIPAIILAIIGITVDKTHKYKTLNIIGIVLSTISMIAILFLTLLNFFVIKTPQ